MHYTIEKRHELSLSQEYIELIARRRGLAFRTFPSEAAAAAWLTE